MGSLLVTIPVTLLLGAVLLALVVRAVHRGDYDDWEGPAHRMLYDEDSVPEIEGDADDGDREGEGEEERR